MNSAEFKDECSKLGLRLEERQFKLFDEFEVQLYQANERSNLTRIPFEQCWTKHFLDSLLFHDLIPVGSRVLDIGSGPGFPAWPLACARPDLQVVAMDSAGKMLEFLSSQRLPNLRTCNGRAESKMAIGGFDVITGRALAPLAVQLEVSVFYAKKDALIIPMRSESDQAEIDRLTYNPLELEFLMVERRVLPIEDAPRLFPVYRKSRPTPKPFPRSWAEIRRQPI